MKKVSSIVASILFLCHSIAIASPSNTTTMYMLDTNGTQGKALGTVSFEDTPKGLAISVDMKGLPAGTHGFHLHENPSCAPGMKDGMLVPGLKAGGHYDPKKTGKHLGPNGDGHLGDLPALVVAKDGTVKTTLIAPRLKVTDIKNRAVMIHVGGDTYADTPPLGGGGARMVCGVANNVAK